MKGGALCMKSYYYAIIMPLVKNIKERIIKNENCFD